MVIRLGVLSPVVTRRHARGLVVVLKLAATLKDTREGRGAGLTHQL